MSIGLCSDWYYVFLLKDPPTFNSVPKNELFSASKIYKLNQLQSNYEIRDLFSNFYIFFPLLSKAQSRELLPTKSVIPWGKEEKINIQILILWVYK